MEPPAVDTTFDPPGGSVFTDVAGRDGPPMMRMFFIQGAFEMAQKSGKLRTRSKVMIVSLISLMFIVTDMMNFRKTRSDNIYNAVGLYRSASSAQVDQWHAWYKACMEFDPECNDKGKKGKIYKLDPEVVKEIFYVLQKPNLREIYDKTENFIRPKTLKKMPTEGQRYMSAFGEVSSYSIFVILTVMIVQQHQYFAKQMTVGLLIVFAYCTVQLKMPKEVNADENLVIQAVSNIPFFNRICYFEIGYMLKTLIYPSLFNTTLNISRLIDVEPILEFKRRILEAQKRLTKAFLPLELIVKRGDTDQLYIEACAEDERKLEEEKAKALEKEAEKEKKEVPKALEGAAPQDEAPKVEETPAEAKEGDQKEDAPAEDNQLIAENAVSPEDEKKKQELADKLAAFGKADPETISAYKYIIYRRGTDTIEYMKTRFQKKKEKETGRSCLSKCGSLIKTLLVCAVVAAFMIPFMYETWQKLQGKAGMFEEMESEETINTGGKSATMTPEEYAQRAQVEEAEKEAAFQERMRKHEERIADGEDVNGEL